MAFIRTDLGTDFTQPSGRFGQLLSSIDTANPSYRGRYHFVRSWLIEFDGEGRPKREIGLDANDFIVLAGPSDKDYGFWLDSNMQYADFVGDTITQEQFEAVWATTGVSCP